MSDAPGGVGWWQASDDKWYPPTARPEPPKPPGVDLQDTGVPAEWSHLSPQAEVPERPDLVERLRGEATAAPQPDLPWERDGRSAPDLPWQDDRSPLSVALHKDRGGHAGRSALWVALHKDRVSIFPYVFGFFLLLLPIVGVWAALTPGGTNGDGSDSNPELDRFGAFHVCTQFVEDRLVSPASAVFPDPTEHDGEVTITSEGDTYIVRSQVDSQNGFGALLTTPFTCKVRHTSGETWRLIDLNMV